MKKTAAVLSLAVLSMIATPAPAAPFKKGPEFQVNDYTTSYQDFPRVAMHSSGSFVVVWNDYQQDSSTYDVMGRIFDSSGQPAGPSFQVNTTTLDYQRFPAIAMDSLGNFVVVWDDYGTDGDGYGITGQRFDSAGTKLGGEFVVNSYTTGWQRFPDITMAPSGDFVVAWESYGQDGDYYGVFGRLFDSSGTPLATEFQVNQYTTGDQQYPRVAMNSSGDFIVVWQSYGQDGSYNGIEGRRFDNTAAPLGSEFAVNSYTTYDQLYPVTTMAPDGSFIVAWDSSQEDGSGTGIFMRRFDSDGAPLSGDLQVNTYTTDYQDVPAISSNSSGDFVVVWNSFGQNNPSSYYDVFGQAFLSDGTRAGDEFQVNTYTPDYQWFPSVSVNDSGDFVVAWDSFYQDGSVSGIFGQGFFTPFVPSGGFAVTSPADGSTVDCSDPATIRPTFAWTTGPFDKFKVWVGYDPNFPQGTRIKSGKWKPITSWEPNKKKWKAACKKALIGDPLNPVLFVRVQGKDVDVPSTDSNRLAFTPTIMVKVNFGP
ncbi:MAG TPA: hypothetical protein VNI57_10840 [Candidatus Saccharimonadales bacterium]|nr:hypothetical protein [Candidatus Saccharimonadales bacterium]